MSEFGDFVNNYYDQFVSALTSFDRSDLERILEALVTLSETQGTLWVAGNGGSAAISDHAVCDTTKWTFVDGQPPIRSISLASNVPMLTALANDLSYEQVFSRQLRYYLKPGDALLVVSSSGNSPNVVEACKYAKTRGVTTIAFVGFEGGELAELADHTVWIPVANYGMAEDAHQSLMHVLTQYLRARAEKMATKKS